MPSVNAQTWSGSKMGDSFTFPEILEKFEFPRFSKLALREKCPNTELFLVHIFLYSVRIQENTDQK